MAKTGTFYLIFLSFEIQIQSLPFSSLLRQNSRQMNREEGLLIRAPSLRASEGGGVSPPLLDPVHLDRISQRLDW